MLAFVSSVTSGSIASGSVVCSSVAFCSDICGSYPAAFLLASRAIELYSSTNLIASFLPLKNILKLANVFYKFFIFFVFKISFQFLFFLLSTKVFLFISCLLCQYFTFSNTIKKSYRIFKSLMLIS